MAKKRASKVEAVKPQRSGKPIRLDLSEEDFDRLETCAKSMGLTKASFARVAVLKYVKEIEAGK